MTALHGGANAVKFTWDDPDGLTYAQMGLNITERAGAAGVPWSNNKPWSNGKNWEIGAVGNVSVSAAAAYKATTITLANEAWRNNLGVGDHIGFFPMHYGLYVITEVIGGGQFRIWPPLRKALTTDNYCHLRPVIVMRLLGENAAPTNRGLSYIETPSASFVEVEHRHVVSAFL
jgi:hypothetical protein